MSRKEETAGYVYSASAYALAGSLTAPAPEFIPTQGASVLSETGGYASARVEGYRFREILSFDEATAVVAGSFAAAEREFSTVAQVRIKNFNLLGMVTADQVVARIAARHYGSPTEVKPVEVTAAGSHFVNLRIAGEKIDPQLCTGAGATSDEFHSYLAQATRDGTTRTTLAHNRECYGLYIPQFGTVYIAEWRPDPYAPTLTMLRVELGCAIEGSSTTASVQGGGRGWP